MALDTICFDKSKLGTVSKEQRASRMSRLVRLVGMLQSGCYRHSQDLMEDLNIRRRTLFRDLEVLVDAGISYGYDPERGYFLHGDANWLPSLSLNMQEMMALALVLRDVSARPSKLAVVGPLRSAISKIFNSCSESDFYSVELCSKLAAHVESRQPDPSDSKRWSLINLLLMACEEEQSCELELNALGHEDALLVMPTKIEHVDGIWRLQAKDVFDGEVFTCPIDHLAEVRIVKSPKDWARFRGRGARQEAVA